MQGTLDYKAHQAKQNSDIILEGLICHTS